MNIPRRLLRLYYFTYLYIYPWFPLMPWMTSTSWADGHVCPPVAPLAHSRTSGLHLWATIWHCIICDDYTHHCFSLFRTFAMSFVPHITGRQLAPPPSQRMLLHRNWALVTITPCVSNSEQRPPHPPPIHISHSTRTHTFCFSFSLPPSLLLSPP